MNAVVLSKRRETVKQANVDVIRCGLGEDVYCLEMSAVAGVKPSRDLRPAGADVPAGAAGCVPHRGQNVPVFDLADLLKLPPGSPDTWHYTVLIDHPRQIYGLLVESVSRVIRLTEDNLLPLPKPLEHTGGCFRGIVDFTRDRHVPREEDASRHLPGVSVPARVSNNRRRAHHQMHLLLNPSTLWAGGEVMPAPSISPERLLCRYAQVAPAANQGGIQQMVTFPAGVIDDWQLLIGLSISQIVEISEPLPLVSVPGSLPAILGFVHWRNCPVPMIDLQASLDSEIADEPDSHLLILRAPRNAGLVALPVTGRLQSLRLPTNHRPCPLPKKSWRPYVLGCFELEERLLILPRLDATSGLAPEPSRI